LLELKPSDPLYDVKVAYYRRDLAIASRRIRVSVCDNDNTKMLFSMLRIIEADQEDFELLISLTASSFYRSIRDAQIAISARNEFKALRLLQQICDDLLSKYPSTLEQDLHRLAHGNIAPFTNERNALIQVKGEKEVLHFYRDLAAVGLKMLQSRDMDEVDAMINEVRLKKHSMVFHYCRSTIARLVLEDIRRGDNRYRKPTLDLRKPTIV
jgi:hypothetical protein